MLVESVKSTPTDKTTLEKEPVLTLHLNFGAADIISKTVECEKYFLMLVTLDDCIHQKNKFLPMEFNSSCAIIVADTILRGLMVMIEIKGQFIQK